LASERGLRDQTLTLGPTLTVPPGKELVIEYVSFQMDDAPTGRSLSHSKRTRTTLMTPSSRFS
jgi:hypothetical protein